MQCVVPENIHTPRPPTEGNGSSEGRWSPKGGNFRGGGVASRVFCLGAVSKIDEQAISYSGGSREGDPPPLSKGVDERPPLSQALDPALHYFTFEWSFKAKSVVFIDDLLFAVG